MPRLPGNVLRVARGGSVRFRIRWTDADGRRCSANFATASEAKDVLATKQNEAERSRVARLTAPPAVEPSGSPPMTIAVYAETWLAAREARVKSVGADRNRVTRYVLPTLGAMPLADVRPRHVRDLVIALRAAKLAPRTVRKVFSVLRSLFVSAQLDEHVLANPCVLPPGILPANVDKDPTWRATAVFTRDELELVISDERIPADRRMLYALMGVAGLRLGEAAGLRWHHYEAAATPLGRLHVNQSYGEPGTKTGTVRETPVHPTLAAVLVAWKLGGWPETFGRAPTADDLVVPTRHWLAMRNRKDATRARRRDLAALGLRHRRGHDLRRTFISLAQADGALPHVLERVTHGPKGDVLSQYTTLPWATLCAEVAKLAVTLRRAAVVVAFATVR